MQLSDKLGGSNYRVLRRVIAWTNRLLRLTRGQIQLDDAQRKHIESEARKLVLWFDEVELSTLKTHIAIHRKLTALVAKRRGVEVSSLGRLSFLAAAKAIHPKNKDLLGCLTILNDARNIIAHEESTAPVFSKLALLGRSIKGPTYDESPASVDDARSQVAEVLQFLQVWATTP